MMRRVFALVLALATLPALAEEPGKMAETAANTLTAPPAAWLGAQPHLVTCYCPPRL